MLLVHPCQFRLARLSLVNTTLLFKNHIKILIFNKIFNFHKQGQARPWASATGAPAQGLRIVRAPGKDFVEGSDYAMRVISQN
jgi:hypothetical protein